MADIEVNSVLIGNGFDIQVGGDDYVNKWIIARLMAKAKSGKYDMLFADSQDSTPIITGDEIVNGFNGMVNIANNVRESKYDDVVQSYGKKDIISALADFKKRYTKNITNMDEIGMEDWIFLFQVFLIDQGDILDQYEAVKQGFERVILDSIFCEGNIQRLYSKMGKAADSYFSKFDNLFTLNYDNTLEKSLNRPVFHLHGDFMTKMISEDPHNAYGYWRIQTGQNIWFPPQLKHCNCNAILDFSGNRKYKTATDLTKCYIEFEKLKNDIYRSKVNLEQILEKFTEEQRGYIKIGVEKNLSLGHNYHFQDFEQLTGTLTIIGLAPQNDSHIFSCINRSNIEKVVFYNYFDKRKTHNELKEEIENLKLKISKTCIVEDVEKLWEEIKISKPHNSTTYTQIWLCSEPNRFLEVFNSFYPTATVTLSDVIKQMKSIPIATEKKIYRMMISELSKNNYHATPKNQEELFGYLVDFGKALKIASVSPQALYFLYTIQSSLNSKKRHNNSKKRRNR